MRWARRACTSIGCSRSAGAGTVVTGTLWSGTIGRGDELELLPSGGRARVRGVQVHDQAVEVAQAGQRVAVNLTGIAKAEIARGDVLAASDAGLRPTYLIDAELEFGEREPAHGERVQVHHGTRESPARLAWLGGRFWQIRLEQPLVAGREDRLVIRQIAPPDTLGGGRVLDAHPRKHGASRKLLTSLERLSQGERARGPIATAEPQPRTRGTPAVPQSRFRQHPVPERARARATAAGRLARTPPGLGARPSRTSPRCVTPAARSGSARRCTTTWMRSARSAPG